jgi:hypothetical protein
MLPRTPQQGIMSGTVHGATSEHDARREGRPSRKAIDLVGLIPFTLHPRVNPGFATKIRQDADPSCILLDHEEDIIVRRWQRIRKGSPWLDTGRGPTPRLTASGAP